MAKNLVSQTSIIRVPHSLWRGSLLPPGREAAPTQRNQTFGQALENLFTTAAQPSGSKLPRHRRVFWIWDMYFRALLRR